jgi:hypothetical protein
MTLTWDSYPPTKWYLKNIDFDTVGRVKKLANNLYQYEWRDTNDYTWKSGTAANKLAVMRKCREQVVKVNL